MSQHVTSVQVWKEPCRKQPMLLAHGDHATEAWTKPISSIWALLRLLICYASSIGWMMSRLPKHLNRVLRSWPPDEGFAKNIKVRKNH